MLEGIGGGIETGQPFWKSVWRTIKEATNMTASRMHEGGGRRKGRGSDVTVISIRRPLLVKL